LHNQLSSIQIFYYRVVSHLLRHTHMQCDFVFSHFLGQIKLALQGK